MHDWKLPWEGGCRCDAVRVRVTQPPLCTGACHCRGCQRMSSSAFSLTIILPTAGFEVIEGEPVVGGLHGKDADHMFCGYCMTWMFTRPTMMPEITNLRATLLDDASWFAPFIETYTSAKLSWVNTGAVHSYPEFPPPDAYMGLIQAFQEKHR